MTRLGIYRPGEEPEPSLLDELVRLYLAQLYPGTRTQIQDHAAILTRVALDEFVKFADNHLALNPVAGVTTGPTWRDGRSRPLVETADGRLLRLTAPVDTEDRSRPA